MMQPPSPDQQRADSRKQDAKKHTLEGSMMTFGTKLRKMWLQSVRTAVLLKATSSSSIASRSRRSPSFCRYSKEASCSTLGISGAAGATPAPEMCPPLPTHPGDPVVPCLGDEIRVAHDGADEEAVVSGLSARLHFGSPQVEMHFVVGTGNGRQVKVAHAAQLQLEGKRWLQVPVDAVLCKLVQHGGVSERPVRQCWMGSALSAALTSSLALNVKNFGNSL